MAIKNESAWGSEPAGGNISDSISPFRITPGLGSAQYRQHSRSRRAIFNLGLKPYFLSFFGHPHWDSESVVLRDGHRTTMRAMGLSQSLRAELRRMVEAGEFGTVKVLRLRRGEKTFTERMSDDLHASEFETVARLVLPPRGLAR
jgi:hypothetical protein